VVSAGWSVEGAEVDSAPTRTFDAEVVLADRSGAVHLLLELTDPDLVRSFTAQSVADVLTGAIGGKPK